MPINYVKEDYQFHFHRFENPFEIVNPNKKDTASMAFNSKKQFLVIKGPANGDFSGFKEGADLSKMKVDIYPRNSDIIWTEALIEDLKIIPIGEEDEIRIKAAGMPLPKKLVEILREETYTPVVKRALIGVKEADEAVRKSFPGYCLTGVIIE